MAAADAVRALYIHIPFCERKCEYCDFVSVAGVRGERDYVDALRAELRALGAAIRGSVLHTVFAGGGTPGLLDPSLLHAVMDEVRASFTLAPEAEMTLEVNPSSCSPERAHAWREAGFNRVSVGVQSTHADVLQFLGRVHGADRALAALREVRAAGFGNVSADLIYAVPGLDDARWQQSLEAVLDAAPDHVSCYELTVEEGTPLHRSVRSGRVRPVDEDVALRQHHMAVGLLDAAGLRQYEVSNFARPGRECAHNLVYWRNEHYAAAGVGAHGHLPVRCAAAFGLEPPDGALSFRYTHGRHIARYVVGVGESPLWVDGVEWIDGPMRDAESVMVGLRLREGIALTVARLATARELAGAGFVSIDGDRVRVTRRGEDVLNQVALRLVDVAIECAQTAACGDL